MTADEFDKGLFQYVEEKMKKATANLRLSEEDKRYFTLLFHIQYYRDFARSILLPEPIKLEAVPA